MQALASGEVKLVPQITPYIIWQNACRWSRQKGTRLEEKLFIVFFKSFTSRDIIKRKFITQEVLQVRIKKHAHQY